MGKMQEYIKGGVTALLFALPISYITYLQGSQAIETAKTQVIVNTLPLLAGSADPTLIHVTTSEIGDNSIPFQIAAISLYGTRIQTLLDNQRWPLHTGRISEQCDSDPNFSEDGIVGVNDSLAILFRGWHSAIDALARINVEDAADELALFALQSVSPEQRSIYLNALEELSSFSGRSSTVSKIQSLLELESVTPRDRGTIISILANIDMPRISIPQNLGIDLTCRQLSDVILLGTKSRYGSKSSSLDLGGALNLAKTELGTGVVFNNLHYNRVLFLKTYFDGVTIENSSFNEGFRPEGVRTSSVPIRANRSAFIDVDFGILDLAQASFRNSYFKDVRFQTTTLTRASFDNSAFKDVTFTDVFAEHPLYLQNIIPDNLVFIDAKGVVSRMTKPSPMGTKFQNNQGILPLLNSVTSKGCDGIIIDSTTFCNYN